MSNDVKQLPNTDQIRWALICIAQDALMARRLCIDAMQEVRPDSQSGDAQLVGAQALLEKIGLLAELHSGDPVPECVRYWMLPPAYRDARKVKVSPKTAGEGGDHGQYS